MIKPGKTLGFCFFRDIYYNVYMQIFEFHFNPKLKEDKVFDSFVYEPESSYEKKLGNLYIIGELQNNVSSSSMLLNNITQVFKKNYYTLSIKSPEKALSYASKKANEFLSEEVKKENVAWLGNLNFAIISLNDFDLTFTKTGDLKILLLRGGQIIDIGKNLEIQEIDPYPLKIFFNVVSGKLIEDDRLLILTKEIFNFFQTENILTKFAQSKDIDSKSSKKIIPPFLFDKGPGIKVSGVCFLTVLTSKQRKESRGPVLFQNNAKKSILKIFSSIRLPKAPKLPKIKIPIKTSSQIVESFGNKFNKKGNMVPIVGLILILLIGFYLFKKAPEKKDDGNIIFEDSIKQNLREPDKLEIIDNPEVTAPSSSLFSSFALPKDLNPPSDIFASYFSNLYFLDKENCEIIKYSYLGENNWDSAKKWLKDKMDCNNPKSIAVDGSVYILNSDNSISTYHSGLYQETIKIDIYPNIENITLIKTDKDIPYLYLLEPANNRIIVIDKKNAEIIKQFQSSKFNNLKDFEISPTGQTIYLLNGSIIYKINF